VVRPFPSHRSIVSDRVTIIRNLVCEFGIYDDCYLFQSKAEFHAKADIWQCFQAELAGLFSNLKNISD